MNCNNCGAPLTLLENKDYYFCEYCGSFHFPVENPDGVRVLEEAPEKINCPVCGTFLSLASIEKYPGLHCTNCQGLLTSQTMFLQMLVQLRAKAAGPPDPTRPLNADDLNRRIYCPYCERMMSTHPYYGPGNFVIDTCIHCGVIWLDHGELSHAINAPGRDRGVKRRKKPK